MHALRCICLSWARCRLAVGDGGEVLNLASVSRRARRSPSAPDLGHVNGFIHWLQMIRVPDGYGVFVGALPEQRTLAKEVPNDLVRLGLQRAIPKSRLAVEREVLLLGVLLIVNT